MAEIYAKASCVLVWLGEVEDDGDRVMPRGQDRLSLDICSLGELLDKYHAYKATRLHDKLYALLGMCSDDLKEAGLEPNYDLEWSKVMCRIVKFFLGDQVSVDTWEHKEMVFIKSKGRILGKISQVERNTESDGQRVKVIFKSTSKQLGSIADHTAWWTLPKSAISIQEEDFICLLQGASKPTIIRLCDDHFMIIMVAAVPLEHIQIDDKNVKRPEIFQSISFTRDFSLVWNWEYSSDKKLDLEEYGNLIHTSNWGSSETGLANRLRNVIRAWNVAQILEDLGEDKKARKMHQNAVKSYGIAFGEKQSEALKIQNGQNFLTWAAGKGHEDVVRLLLKVKADINSNDGYGRTPLSWAAENGHEAIVKLLLKAKANADLEDRGVCQTPLSRAARNGHEAVLELLIGAKADVDSKDNHGPLCPSVDGQCQTLISQGTPTSD
jgi:Ankyrin repeats (3 copies)